MRFFPFFLVVLAAIVVASQTKASNELGPAYDVLHPPQWLAAIQGGVNYDASGNINIRCNTGCAGASVALTIAGGIPFDSTGNMLVDCAAGCTGNGSSTITVPGIIFATPDATPAASLVWCQNDADTVQGLTCNVPTNATAGFEWSVNGVDVASIDKSGNINTVTGSYGQSTNCAQSTTNASPSLVTLNEWACKLTSLSAAATVFTITYPGAVTLTNAPMCFVQDLAAIVTEPTCTTSTTTATLTYAVAPGAVAFANVLIFKNGP